MSQVNTQTGQALDNIRVMGVTRLVSPASIKAEIPVSDRAREVVQRGREAVAALVRREDRRFLAIVGPCSVHDPKGALEYAHRLVALREVLPPSLYVVMRVYFEKPRTTVGWKGLINDPHLDDSCDMMAGLRKARELLVQINEWGLPTATEFLDPITPQYIADLISWAAIGARTTESQTHREMASGLSMPIGFKNGTDGRIQTAIDALLSAGRPHSFLGIDQQGMTSVIKTAGNPDCHVVLRGGVHGPNYQQEQISQTVRLLSDAGLPEVLVVDCSHANSMKNPSRQVDVWRDVIQQRQAGESALVGAMLESYLKPGQQPLLGDPSRLEYGVSITDACLGWDQTAELLNAFPEAW